METNWANTFLEALFSMEDREQKQKKKVLDLLEKEGFQYKDLGRRFVRTIDCEGLRHTIEVDAYMLYEQKGNAIRYIMGMIEEQERQMLDHYRKQIRVIKL